MSLEEDREQLVEQFGVLFDESGRAPMGGRVMGYLMLSNAEQVSSQELKEALHASSGSISSTTRSLSSAGFIRRVFKRGSRVHHFRAADDVWGDMIASEHRYFAMWRGAAEEMLTHLGSEDEGPRQRLLNMRDYFQWREDHHHTMYAQWLEYKESRRGRNDSPAPDEQLHPEPEPANAD
ncbi:hypothetical protein AXA44_45685 [Rhodococcus sp. SC4]|nr:hypothetical protein AXA44_45685 [Rhodococcus sp. SC4]